MCACSVIGATAVSAFSPACAASRALTLGFFDDVYLSGDRWERAAWYDRSIGVGARIVRIGVSWAAVSPNAPAPGSDLSDPANPAYNWAAADGAIRDATVRGLRILVTLGSAPGWAEGTGRPRNAAPGTWKPNPTYFGEFARAAARRYSGAFTDPTGGGALPRVRYWQAWNEPNLSALLTPQWVRSGRSYAPASPALYRQLLNALFRAVKGVQADNFVVSAGTAPYGDPQPGGRRIMPVRFMRELFCLRGARLTRSRCPDPARLDAISHHPYAIEGPLRHALNADDASIPDVGRITRVLRAAEHRKTVLPRGGKRIWVTEVSWDSSPPDPDGVPAQRQARWLEEAFYVLWLQRVDTITWFQVRDQAPVPSYAATNQSGVFLRNGDAKPAATAFRFPFVTERSRGATVRAWGLAPGAGPVVIERKLGARWVVERRLRAGASRVFTSALRLPRGGTLRARVAGDVSLVWTQR